MSESALSILHVWKRVGFTYYCCQCGTSQHRMMQDLPHGLEVCWAAVMLPQRRSGAIINTMIT